MITYAIAKKLGNWKIFKSIIKNVKIFYPILKIYMIIKAKIIVKLNILVI